MNKAYDIPQDYYLRGLYRFSEVKENEIGSSIDKFFFDKVLNNLYGNSSLCVKRMTMRIMKDTNEVISYEFDDKIVSNYKDSNKEKLIDTILSSYSKCRYGAIFLSSIVETGHRTIIFFEYINK